MLARRHISLLRSAAAASIRDASSKAASLRLIDEFLPRHIGPRDRDVPEMLKAIDPSYKTTEDLVNDTVPAQIRLKEPMTLEEEALSESEALAKLKAIASKNKVLKSFIGMGYYDTITPGVILRNILENPGWYTSYTPYQAEIAQGRLESLLNFQTMVADLTGMDISNASLLDEATAAAEAMQMTFASHSSKRNKFFVASDIHPQTLATVQTRATGVGIDVVVGDPATVDFSSKEFAGALLQYPNTFGAVAADGYAGFLSKAKAAGVQTIVASDLLSLCLLKSPGELGFDIAVGSSQRFGVPMGYGGPHAAFLATKVAQQRRMPGRVIGISVDAQGNRALRMAMQTREQHIRRDKATSNICTAQALLSNMAAMYAVYHGPEGLKDIAGRVHALAKGTAAALASNGLSVGNGPAGSPSAASGGAFFDTFTVDVRSLGGSAAVLRKGEALGINFRSVDAGTIGISFDERTEPAHIKALLEALSVDPSSVDLAGLVQKAAGSSLPASLARTTAILTHSVFNTHHSESQLLRYIHRLQAKDISLTYSMISLGSCTMKLNATSELMPITWPELANMHPFAPKEQAAGYEEMLSSLSRDLCTITDFAAVSLQPNSGAAGEYAGLMAIRSYQQSRGQGHRDVCIIPISAHGTNPASAVMAGYKVVVVNSDEKGNVDYEDLSKKVAANADKLAALMITYPSTYGVFEEGVKDIIDLVHSKGGQVYMDGANMNAQVALTSPGSIGADVCHLNLHKTFAIPHGGGGPGVGAIGVAAHLAPFLPGHPVQPTGGFGKAVQAKTDLAVAAAPQGSALINAISWMYISMLGASGLKKSTETAILNANYLAARLAPHYQIAYTGTKGRVAHEFILDLRPLKAASNGNFSEADLSKRLMDYGFHSPTMSWPVAGTLMVEPTESEDKGELDRFAEAMISIRHEIEEVVTGKADPVNNMLKNAPHTAAVVTADSWDKPYSRQRAAYPAAYLKSNKFWPTVGRVDDVHGDRNLCACLPVETYAEPAAAGGAAKKEMK